MVMGNVDVDDDKSANFQPYIQVDNRTTLSLCCTGEAAEAWSGSYRTCCTQDSAIDKGPQRQSGGRNTCACPWQDQTHGSSPGMCFALNPCAPSNCRLLMVHSAC